MMNQTPYYEPPQSTRWQGRSDSLPNERFFQRVLCKDLTTEVLNNHGEWVFAGFCSDEGVRRNLGRVGAKLGPDCIRTQLAKLACHHESHFIDVGNIICNDLQLEAAQHAFGKLIEAIHQQGNKTIAFGGGHEIAWAHYQGLASCYSNIGIINFDAHFDLRPLQNNQSTSGTPFAQIHAFCQEKSRPFHYACLGIQPATNTQSLFKKARETNVAYLAAEALMTQPASKTKAWVDDFIAKVDVVYLTLCLDAFAECFAPGVSAPQPLGLAPWTVLPILKHIFASKKVVSFDVAELSPPLDKEHQTAKLAATIIADVLNEEL